VAIEALDLRALNQPETPGLDAFLRFVGSVCAISSVALVAVVPDGLIWNVWVRLSADIEGDQDRLYIALQRYRSSVPPNERPDVDLHVVFPDEDEAAFPAAATIHFARE